MALGSMLLILVTGAGMVASWWGPRWRLWRVPFADANVLEADVLPLRGRAVIVDLGTPHR
jgi:hypothetical protein